MESVFTYSGYFLTVLYFRGAVLGPKMPSQIGISLEVMVQFSKYFLAPYSLCICIILDCFN